MGAHGAGGGAVFGLGLIDAAMFHPRFAQG